MQLSTSSFPLDPSLAGIPVGAAATIPGASVSVDAAPGAFGALLLMQSRPAPNAPAPGSEDNDDVSTALADGETVPWQGFPEEQASADDFAPPDDAPALAWLLANGFVPTAPVAIPADTPPPSELLGASVASAGETDDVRAAKVPSPAPESPAFVGPFDGESKPSPRSPSPVAIPGVPASRAGSVRRALFVDTPPATDAAGTPAAEIAPSGGKRTDRRGAIETGRADISFDAGEAAEAALETQAAVSAVRMPRTMTPREALSSDETDQPSLPAAAASGAPKSADATGKFRPAYEAAPAGPNDRPISPLDTEPDPFTTMAAEGPAVISDPRAMIARYPSRRAQEFASSLPADATNVAAKTSGEPTLKIESVAIAAMPSDTRTMSPSTSRAIAGGRANRTAESILSIPPDTSGAKFAVRPSANDSMSENTISEGKKESLDTKQQSVMFRDSDLGTNVAKTEILMPVTAPTSVSASAPVGRDMLAAPVGTFDALLPETGEVASELTQAARRSVESIMDVAHHFAADKRAVTLQFSVSGVDLGVRVELRDDGVHTTFRTDSPELRAALAQEWQSVTQGQADRSSRLVDPVFTANSSQGGSAGQDASGMDQRGSQARPDPRFSEDFAALRRANADKAVVDAPAAPAPRSVPVSTPGRLHTFA